jgi:hypothetical protein
MVEEKMNYTKTYKTEEGENVEEPGQVIISVPENLQEACRVDGEDVVFSLYLQQRKIKAQAICRSCDTPEQAQEAINNWVPGVARRAAGVGGVSKKALLNALKEMAPDKLGEILKLAGVK